MVDARRQAWLRTLSKPELLAVHREETTKLVRDLIAKGILYEGPDKSVRPTKRGRAWLAKNAPEVLARILARDDRV